MAGKNEYTIPRLQRAYADGRDRAFGLPPPAPRLRGSPEQAAFDAGYQADGADSTCRTTGNYPPFALAHDNADPIITDGGDQLLAV